MVTPNVPLMDSFSFHRSPRPQHGQQSRRAQRGGRRPVVAYRSRNADSQSRRPTFQAPERWYEPTGRTIPRIVTQDPGRGYTHAVTAADVRERLASLPSEFSSLVEVVQLSQMTRKKRIFPLYGMQWGPNVYLYPIETSLVETYLKPPAPQLLIETRMYGGEWHQLDTHWELVWTPETIRDFYLNNVLIHEVGHLVDTWNTNFDKRERYANWFAIEHGYRATR